MAIIFMDSLSLTRLQCEMQMHAGLNCFIPICESGTVAKDRGPKTVAFSGFVPELFSITE